MPKIRWRHKEQDLTTSERLLTEDALERARALAIEDEILEKTQEGDTLIPHVPDLHVAGLKYVWGRADRKIYWRISVDLSNGSRRTYQFKTPRRDIRRA